MSGKVVKFIDTTLRDGVQSLWAIKLTYGMVDAVAGEIDKAGYDYIDLPIHALYCKAAIRFFKEEPWQIMRLFHEKFKHTKMMMPIHNHIDMLGEAETRSMIRLWHDLLIRMVKPSILYTLANTRNELDRHYPWIIPMIRDYGLPFCSVICYHPSPRTTDEYYAGVTRRVMEYQPKTIWLKDAGGLMTVERIRTLLPAIQKEAKGVPISIHTHGMSTNSGRVVAEAMKLGVDHVQTCIPPLANGSSHVSIYNAMHNAKVLGLEPDMTDVDAIREAERRLRIIAKLKGLPEGIPLEYDHGVYTHMIPGGVISNLRDQLAALGMAEKLDEVLEETVQIIEDLGYPMMITPFSQYIVSQAAVNVSTGERYKVLLDPIIELALGVHGWEDVGVPWMKPNVKDMLVSSPNAKMLKKRYEEKEAIEAEEGSVEKIRAGYGMTNASDEDFLMYHVMKGDEEIKQVKPPKTYYTGKEPLALLLKELSRDHDIHRLQMLKGKSFFEFRQNTSASV